MRKLLIVFVIVLTMLSVLPTQAMGAIKLGFGCNMGNFDGESYTDLQLEGEYFTESFKFGFIISDGKLNEPGSVFNPIITITHNNIYGSYKLLSNDTLDLYAGIASLNTNLNEEIIFSGMLITGEASIKVNDQVTFNSMIGFSLSGNCRIESLSLEDDASIFTFRFELETNFSEKFSGRVGYRNINYGLAGGDIGDSSIYSALSWKL